MLTLSHKKLNVYQTSLLLVKEIYQLTSAFPKEELFGLTSQLRRAAVSVASNLSEGAARISKPDKKRFFEISRSSIVEVDTQLEIAIILGYLKPEELNHLSNRIESCFGMLSKLILNLTKTISGN